MNWLLLILAISGFATSCWAWGSIQFDRGGYAHREYLAYQLALMEMQIKSLREQLRSPGFDRDPITGRFVKRGGK